jgi:hypothetical protein
MHPATLAGLVLTAASASACIIPIGPNGLPSGDGGPMSTIDGPVPTGSWTDVTGNLVGKMAGCGTLTLVTAKPDEDLLLAGISGQGVWGSSDGGASWSALGAGPGSATIPNRPSAFVFDPQVAQRFWETGLYGDSVYVTMDDGQTFSALAPPNMGSDLLGIDFGDPARQTMLLGAHETTQHLYLSTNGGMAWTDIGKNLPAGANCTLPLVLDPQKFLLGCTGYGGGAVGVYGSQDGGMHWAALTGTGGGYPPMRASDNYIYWVSPNGSGLTRSMDGQTWTDVAGSGVLGGSRVVELPGQKLAAMGQQYVVGSSDGGKTWAPLTSGWPTPTPASGQTVYGLAYSSKRNAIYIWYNACPSSTAPLPAGSILRYDL